jgi:hypothetical protein
MPKITQLHQNIFLKFFIIVCYFLDFSKKQRKGVQKLGYDKLFQNFCVYIWWSKLKKDNDKKT